MKVGDYVRTKEFGINKVKWFDNEEPILENGFTALQHSGYKSSSNIIDLIEVGDYVNGECVYSRCETKLWLDGDTGEILIIDGEPDEPIKLIVTKEQFASMEYKVGE